MQPDSKIPADWIRFARSDLGVAKGPPAEDVMLETLCFHAQQAVEKSIKAVLVHFDVSFPKIHNIEVLIDLLPQEVVQTSDLKKSTFLTMYASILRYPGEFESVDMDRYLEAVRLAEIVVKWADDLINSG